MNPIYIVGAGGLGKEIFYLIREINKINSLFDFKGFLESDISKTHFKIANEFYPVFNEDDFISKNHLNETINIAIAIGNPHILAKAAHKYQSKTNFNFPNLVHPNLISYLPSLRLMHGNVITAGCIMLVDITIGAFNIFNIGCTIGHDCNIGSFNIINPSANISGGVKIGDCNIIGTNSTVLQYLSIGNNCTISAASFVAKNVENNQILMGNPARVIGLNN